MNKKARILLPMIILCLIVTFSGCGVNFVGQKEESQNNSSNGQTISKSEYIANQLLGEWELDADKTYQETQKSLMSLFGTGIKYGSSMKFKEDGAFSYYIGIGIGGEGTYSVNGSDISYSITTYEEGSSETGEIILDYSSEPYYLITDFYGDALYWKPAGSTVNSDKATNVDESNTDVPNVNKPNSNTEYAIYDSAIQAAINSALDEGSGILYDIDGNGTKELIMLYTNNQYQVVYDVYTIVSGQVVVLAKRQALYFDAGGPDGNISIIHDGDQSYFTSYVDNGETGYEATRTSSWKLFKLVNNKLTEADNAEYVYQVMEDMVSLKASLNGKEVKTSEYQKWAEKMERNRIMVLRIYGDTDGIPLKQLLSKKGHR